MHHFIKRRYPEGELNYLALVKYPRGKRGMYNYSDDMAYWSAGGPERRGPGSLILTLTVTCVTIGAGHLTSFPTLEP